MSGDGTERAAGATAGGRARARSWLLAGGTFVVGLFVGAIALGLLRETPPPAATAADPPAATASAEPSSPSPGASARITVNEACLRVVNETRDVLDALQDLGRSAADLDISGVDQAIRDLQPLQERLRANLDDCEADTTLPGDLSPLPSPGPSPTTPTTPD